MNALATAVVTGATGFIGSTLVRRLAASGTRVICPVRAESARTSRIERVPGVELVSVGRLDATTLERDLSGVTCDAVFHLAAGGVVAGEREPWSILESNATLTAHVVVAAKSWSPKRVVFSGSCSEYRPVTADTRIDEETPLGPTTLYGAAKVAAHVFGAALASQLGLEFVGLRIFGTFGIGEAPVRLIPHMIDRLARGEEPELTPGVQVRDLTYVDDVADALMIAATHPGLRAGQAYNVCSGIGVSIANVARRVSTLMGKPNAPLGLGRRSYRPGEPMWIVGDPSRFCAATGYEPKVSLDDGIARMIAASRSR
jgi:nucleoside-diphosphate-sugar epimerase